MTLKPKEYFTGKSDPEYRRASRDYYLSHLFPDYPNVAPENGKILEHYLKQLNYIEHIVNGWTHTSGENPVFSMQADRFVIEAIREFGVDALRLPADDEEAMRGKPPGATILRITNQLGVEVSKIIRYWRDQVMTGNRAAKKRGVECLKKVSRALIPETRGKKAALGIGPGVVKAVYYEIIFDLYQIEHYLRSSAGPRNYSLKIKTASQNFGISVDDIREILHLDESDQPKPGRPLSLRSYARIFTARRLDLTEQTVSNNLATKF